MAVRGLKQDASERGPGEEVVEQALGHAAIGLTQFTSTK